MRPRLSARLFTIYHHLLEDQDVWDFCCDHGYLGTAAYQSQKFKNIYFVDPVASIMESLKERFFKFIFDSNRLSAAHFLQQTGQSLQILVEGTACIAGVGGHVIFDILLSLANNHVLKANRLILGPHRDADKLLSWLSQNTIFTNYRLSLQKEITEDGRTHTFFIYDRTNRTENQSD